jgi:hypothetical protein
MLGSYLTNFLCLAGILLEAYVVVWSLCKKSFVRNFPINFYMLCEAAVTVGLYFCSRRFGTSSQTYAYYYYYTETLLTILMFWVIIRFYQIVFSEMQISQYVRKGAVLLLLATAIFSYGAALHQFHSNLRSHFVVELGQDLYFVGVVLTYVLWGVVLKLHETRARLVQLILALGVYFSGTAGTYAIGNLFPHLYLPFFRFLLPIFGLWLPLAWAYTFTKVPEDARLATATLVARAR